MRANGKGYVTRALMLALGLFLLLPVATANAQNRRERWEERRERREERRDRREARRDQDGDGDFDARDRYIRQQRRSNGNAYGHPGRVAGDVDGDGDYDQRDAYIIQQQRNGGVYG